MKQHSWGWYFDRIALALWLLGGLVSWWDHDIVGYLVKTVICCVIGVAVGAACAVIRHRRVLLRRIRRQ